MKDVIINIQFAEEEFEMIQKYQDASEADTVQNAILNAISLALDHEDELKEQEKKQITLHKKHVITWGRNDAFSMRKLYEAICETLLDEGELFIARTDDHEKVDFVFYVTEGR
jgi:hypothetical protein